MLKNMKSIWVPVLSIAVVMVAVFPVQADVLSEARTFIVDNRNTET